MNLKKLRIRLGLSQSDLARLSGIASSVISNYECGEREPGLKNLRKLRKALDCTWDQLLGGGK